MKLKIIRQVTNLIFAGCHLESYGLSRHVNNNQRPYEVAEMVLFAAECNEIPSSI